MKKEIKKGDEFEVEIISSKKDGSPIARIEGMIAFINRNDNSKVIIGASYIVRVDDVKETFAIITPLVVLKTKAQNEDELSKKLSLIARPKRPRIRKPKNRDPFSGKEEKEK